MVSVYSAYSSGLGALSLQVQHFICCCCFSWWTILVALSTPKSWEVERDRFIYVLFGGLRVVLLLFPGLEFLCFRLRASEFGTNEEDASPPDRRPPPPPPPCADELRTTITGIDFKRSRKSRPPRPPYANKDVLEKSYQDQEQGVPRHHFEWCYARGRAQSYARGDLLFAKLLLSQIIKIASVLARGRAQSNSTTPKSSSAWCMECPAKKRC